MCHITDTSSSPSRVSRRKKPFFFKPVAFQHLPRAHNVQKQFYRACKINRRASGRLFQRFYYEKTLVGRAFTVATGGSEAFRLPSSRRRCRSSLRSIRTGGPTWPGILQWVIYTEVRQRHGRAEDGRPTWPSLLRVIYTEGCPEASGSIRVNIITHGWKRPSPIDKPIKREELKTRLR